MIVAFTLAVLVYARSQTPRSGGEAPPPKSQAAKQVALQKTITTQQRLNRYFHGDVVPKLKNCWGRVQGRGTIALKYSYVKGGSGKWMFDKLEVNQSTLPRGQDEFALRCMQDAVRGTSFPVDQTEANQNTFVLSWSWPVPFPANANELTSAMFAARSAGGAGTGGGCDGHGAQAKCFTCQGATSCIKVCVGYATCTLGATYCRSENSCASGGPFGVAGSGFIY